MTKQIPGWTRNVTYTNPNIPFPFTDLFQNNVLTNPDISSLDHQLTAAHQNLYEPKGIRNSFVQDPDIFVVSANLKTLSDLEQLHLFEDYFEKAKLSFGCFTLPPGVDDLEAIVFDNNFNQILKSLPCHIVLVDALAIEKSSPLLPKSLPTDSNKERILQTAIMGLIEPVFNTGMIGVDFVDLEAIFPSHTKTNYVYGVGIGFVEMTDDIAVASIDAMRTISSQINRETVIDNRWVCWANVCGSSNITMNHYGALAEQVLESMQEEGDSFVTLTVDRGIGNYIMTSYYLQLELD